MALILIVSHFCPVSLKSSSYYSISFLVDEVGICKKFPHHFFMHCVSPMEATYLAYLFCECYIYVERCVVFQAKSLRSYVSNA